MTPSGFIECPSCGARCDSGTHDCPECGSRVDRITESFAPVSSATPSREALIDVDGAVLVVVKGPEVGERFYLDRASLVMGRDPGCDIFLNDVTVSRTHAAVDVGDGRVTVRDTGSLNGTYVNGIRVDSAPLAPGDSVQVGRFVMVFHVGGEA